MLAAAVFAAALLTGCNKDRTATVVYTDVPPPLTRMTYENTLPPETYSEYMATYSRTSETETEDRRSFLFENGISADTGVTAPSMVIPGSVYDLRADTGVVTAPPEESGETDGETVTCVTEVTEMFPESTETVLETAEISEISEISETTTTTTVPLEHPRADTGITEKISADTAQSRSSFSFSE